MEHYDTQTHHLPTCTQTACVCAQADTNMHTNTHTHAHTHARTHVLQTGERVRCDAIPNTDGGKYAWRITRLQVEADILAAAAAAAAAPQHEVCVCMCVCASV